MKTGLVLVNYNDYETINKFIDNVKNFGIIDTIVIVDNASTDDSCKKIKKITNEKIVLLKNESNLGYASGINVGSRYLIKKFGKCNIIVSNADIEIYSEDDIKKLLKDLNKSKSTAVCAPIIKQHDGYDKGWKIPTPKKDAILNIVYIHRFLRPKLLGYSENYYNKELVNVEQVSGCFFLIKSEALEMIDYLDEGTFLYYEENIMGTKLKNKNLKTIIDTKVEVFHNHSITIDKSVKKINKYKILKKSQLYFHKKYNDANLFDIILLTLTNKLTLFILYIVYFIK